MAKGRRIRSPIDADGVIYFPPFLRPRQIEVKKAQPKHAREPMDTNRRHIGSYMGDGAQSGKYNHNGNPGLGGMGQGQGQGQNPMMGGVGAGGMGGMGGMGGNMGMGGMMPGGFDPQAMAMMYQRMMMMSEFVGRRGSL